MKCPRNHGNLSKIGLKDEFDSISCAGLCDLCGGVFLESAVAQEVLGLSARRKKDQLEKMTVAIHCPKCGHCCKCCTIVGIIGMYCEHCSSYWFDANFFPLLVWTHHEDQTGVPPENSPFVPLNLTCSDCGAKITQRTEAFLCSLGVVCEKCSKGAVGFSGNKVRNYQMTTYRGMEIKIDHWSQSARSRISVTPVEPCLFDATLRSLHWMQRILPLRSKNFEFTGTLNRFFSSEERIHTGSPLHIFLSQPGVAPLFLDLFELGRIVIEFKPHNLTFDFEADRVSTEVRLKFENTVRHVLIAYTRFVSLANLYT